MEDKYDFNTEYITEIGRMMVRSGAVKPCLQFKITAMMSADIVVKMTSMLGEGSISLSEMAEQVKHFLPSLNLDFHPGCCFHHKRRAGGSSRLH